MPLFGEIEPAQIGQATRFDHPLNEWLGVKFGSGQAAQLGPRLFNFMGEAGDTSKKLTPKEANDQFGIEGHLKFDSDVSTDRATTMRQRKEEELKYAAYFQTASHSWLSGKALLGFGAEMLGANTHPVDLAINFLPFVGSEVKAARMAETGASAFRIALARGLVTEESIAMSRLPLVARFPNFSASTIDATLGNAVLEIPNFYLARRDQTDYTADDLLTNVFAGGLAGGAFGAGIKQLMKLSHIGYEKLTGPTRENMFKEGIGNHLSSDPRNIGDNAMLDSASILSELRQSLTTSEDIVASAKLALDEGKLGKTEAGIVAKLLDRYAAGERRPEILDALAEITGKEWDGNAKQTRTELYPLTEATAQISKLAAETTDPEIKKKLMQNLEVLMAKKSQLEDALVAIGERNKVKAGIESGKLSEGFTKNLEKVIKSRQAQAERAAAGTMPEARQRELQANIARASTVTKEQVDKFAKRVDPNDVIASHEADAAAKTEVATEMEGSLNDYISNIEKRAKELAETDPDASAKLLAEAEAVRNDLKSGMEMAELASMEDATINAMTNCITGI